MGNTRKITVLGTSETKLLGELSKIRKTNICVPSYRIRILSYDREDEKGLHFLSFGEEADSISIVNRDYREEKNRCINISEDALNSRYVKDGGANGIWLAYRNGSDLIILGPRDSQTNMKDKKIPSRFISDICRMMKIGDVSCDFCSPARDLYMATMLNEFGDSERMYVFWLKDEKEENVIRPLCAFPGKVYPRHLGMKNPSEETLIRKCEKHKNIFENAVETASAIIKRDAGEEYLKDLAAQREKIYEDIVEKGTASAGSIQIMSIDPSQLLVLSYTGYKDGKHSFMSMDPWDIEMFSFDDIAEDLRVTINKDRIGKKIEEALNDVGFLIEFENYGRKKILIPGTGFVNDFCHRAGIGKIAEENRHAEHAYLASILTLSERQICFNAIHEGTNEEFSLYYAIKTSSLGREKSASMLSTYKTVKERMKKEGLVMNSWRIDNGTDVTVDFVLCDKNGNAVFAPPKKDICIGVELQMSEGLSYAYRLCGIFYYKDSIFYCGNSATGKDGQEYGYSAVYGKRKTGNPNLIKSLLDGFFDGIERAPGGRERVRNACVYRYLEEQAGILKGNDRSPYIGTLPRQNYTGSVFEKLAAHKIDDVSKEIMKFAETEYEPECQIGKKIGKKRIMIAAAGCSKTEGTMLDVLLEMASIVKKSASVNLRHGAMESIGIYLAKYGYRKLPPDQIQTDGGTQK